MKKTFYLFVSIFAFVLYACDDDADTAAVVEEEAKPGILDIAFSNTIDGEAIVLNTETYTNLSKENFSIAELKYIVSNIVLIKADGSEFVYPADQSYFVVDEEEASSKLLKLSAITAGEYSKIRFGIGVEQSKYPLNGVANFIPTAEEKGMLWSWSAGYKFLKFEGAFSSDEVKEEDFLIHIGTHGTALDNYKELTLELPNTVTIADGASPEVSIETDIIKIFDGSNSISLAAKNEIQVDPVNAPKIAENVTTMFAAMKVAN